VVLSGVEVVTLLLPKLEKGLAELVWPYASMPRKIEGERWLVDELVDESFPIAALSFCNARNDCVIGFAHCVRVSGATAAGIVAVRGPEKESWIDRVAFVMPEKWLLP